MRQPEGSQVKLLTARVRSRVRTKHRFVRAVPVRVGRVTASGLRGGVGVLFIHGGWRAPHGRAPYVQARTCDSCG